MKAEVEQFLTKLRKDIAIEHNIQLKVAGADIKDHPVPEIEVKYGRNFAKILITNRHFAMKSTSTWGFIALNDNPKLNAKAGDLLKPASHASPAKHARGSILDGTAKYNIFGPAYL